MTERSNSRLKAVVARYGEKYPLIARVESVAQKLITQPRVIFQRERPAPKEVDPTKPQHIAFIIDGNRRWAKQKEVPPEKGHQVGADNIRNILTAVRENGIDTASIYLLSQANLAKRGNEELDHLKRIIQDTIIDTLAPQLIAEGVKVNFIGDKKGLPKEMKKKLRRIRRDKKNRSNSEGTVNFALNYSGRDEIVHAVRKLRRNPLARTTEEAISKRLYTNGQPDVDLLIRTGGDNRISDFMPWQATQAEIIIRDEMWPEFTVGNLKEVLGTFASTERRGGK